ncbi:MAG TPA: beta-glucosidase [Treponema sp.]|nr:beta-glucosidase [Treponema sp.]
MRKNGWRRPVVTIGIIILVIIALIVGVNKYLAGRSVSLTKKDVISTLQSLSVYLSVLGIIITATIAVCVVSLKMKFRGGKMIRRETGIAVAASLVVIVTAACFRSEYSLLNNVFGDKYYISPDTINRSKMLTEDISAESTVLLKNTRDVLPLTDVKKLNVFGWSSTNPIYGGTGSGSVNTTDCITLLQGLTDAGYELNTEISDFYTAYRKDRPIIAMNGQDWTIPEPSMSEYDAKNIFEDARNFSDTALVIIARSGGEGADLPLSITDEATFKNAGAWGSTGVTYTTNSDDIDPSKSYLELSNRETALVKRVAANFKNVVIVINSANAMELGRLNQYDSVKAVLWCAGPGQTGFESLGKIINGTMNPSGKLVDTWVYDLHAIPAFNNIGNFQYTNVSDAVNKTAKTKYNASFVNYAEGIYVGYKFYETADAEGFINYKNTVQYPFGFGLSYTNFNQKITSFTDDGSSIKLTVTVTNDGTAAGKDVVEAYFTPPYINGGIEKASVNLIGFAKTEMIQPGASDNVTVSFTYPDMASYDYLANKCYVLDKGTYTVSIRSDSHSILDSRNVLISETVIHDAAHDGKRPSDDTAAVNNFDFAEGSHTYLSRTNHFANYKAATAAPGKNEYAMSDSEKKIFFSLATYDSQKTDDNSVEKPVTGAHNGITIRDMKGASYDDSRWEKLLDELTTDEMVKLIEFGYASARIKSIALPATIECDGPAAIHNNYNGVSGTAFPAATMIAATWNKELADKRGNLMGLQCNEMRVAGWYGPAMNIHRTAFSGRNFEYYSEDSVLSGTIGASEISGAKNYGVQTYMKHFALNDQETNRSNMLCTWSNEQAAREIYLKPFEYSVKNGKTTTAMTSFNYIGTQWAGACPALLTNILRGEWGFRGATVTDWFAGSYDGFMDADAAIRTGGDKMLSTQGDPEAIVSNTDKPATVVAMRNASHNILYSIANSNAMNDENFENPGWVKKFILIDVIFAVLLCLWETVIIAKYISGKKKNAQ